MIKIAIIFLILIFLYIPTIAMAADPVLYAVYPGYGLYSWDGSTWLQVATEVPLSWVASGKTVYAVFANVGVWVYNGSSWTQINVNSGYTDMRLAGGNDYFAVYIAIIGIICGWAFIMGLRAFFK